MQLPQPRLPLLQPRLCFRLTHQYLQQPRLRLLYEKQIGFGLERKKKQKKTYQQSVTNQWLDLRSFMHQLLTQQLMAPSQIQISHDTCMMTMRLTSDVKEEPVVTVTVISQLILNLFLLTLFVQFATTAIAANQQGSVIVEFQLCLTKKFKKQNTCQVVTMEEINHWGETHRQELRQL